MTSVKGLVMGQVVSRGIGRPDSVKVRCLKMVLDKYLLKYFNKRSHHWALDTAVKVEVGDIVLIKSLPDKVTLRIGHEVHEIVHKLGAVVDPVTGKRCRGKEFIDETEREFQRLRIAQEYSEKTKLQSS